MPRKLEITASLEDYLETIYIICKTSTGARVTDIANELDISKPSVNRAINTLKEGGLVNHVSYGEVTLTDKGLNIAKEVMKRHILIKKFLNEVLGVSEENAENDACFIEHSISSESIEKMSHYLEKVFKDEVFDE